MKRNILLLIAMILGFGLDGFATAYNHTLLTNGTNSVYFSTYKTGTDTYQFVIEANGTPLSGLGGSYCNQNGKAGYYMNGDHMKIADDGSMIIVDVKSSTAPTMYTPLHVMMPGEVSFEEIAQNDGMEFVEHEAMSVGSTSSDDNGDDNDNPDTSTTGNNAVWTATATGSNYTLSYSITWNKDRTLTIRLNELSGDIAAYEGLVKQVNVNDKYYTFTGSSVTTLDKFDEGTVPSPFFFYIAYTGDAARIDVTYTVGISNDKKDNGNAWDGKNKGAGYELEYEIAWNKDRTLTVTIVSLTGELTQKTGFIKKVCIDDVYYDFSSNSVTTKKTYNKGDSPYPFFFYFPYEGDALRVDVAYTVGDTNNGDGGDPIDDPNEDPEPDPTPDPTPGETSAVWNGTCTGADYALDYTITWNTDQTLTVRINSLTGDITTRTGLVKQISINDTYYDFKGSSITTTEGFSKGDKPAMFFYFPYSGDALRLDIDYTVGDTNGTYVEGTAWNGTATGDDYELKYSIVYNSAHKLEVTIESLTGAITGYVGLEKKVSIDDVYYDFTDSNTITTSATYTRGDSPYPFFFYFPYADGALRIDVSYTVGDTNDVANGISIIPTLCKGNGTVYNLAGQKVCGTQKGVVIKNGKKYIIK